MKPILLKGFQRVALKAGESKRITFHVSPQQLVEYKKGQWVIEAGDYEFKVGASCTDIRLKGNVTLKGDNLILTNGREVFFSKNE